MVSEIVMSVLSDNTNRRITIQEAVAQTEEKAKKEAGEQTEKVEQADKVSPVDKVEEPNTSTQENKPN